MSKLTGNYKFIMPELTDSPPDITVMNSNWQEIDAKLKEQDENNSEAKNLISIRPTMTTTDLAYYVNTTTGNDSNSGLASGIAFKTLQKAIDSIPPIVNHTITINVVEGTYNEDVLCEGFTGKGRIYINGDTRVSTSRSVKSISCGNSAIYITITGFNVIGRNSSAAAINMSRISYFVVNYCNIVSNDLMAIGIAAYSSKGIVTNCTISTKLHGVYAWASDVISDTNTGTSNNYALTSVRSSVLSKTGSQPSGAEYKDGGMVVDLSGVPSGTLPTSGGTLSGPLGIVKVAPVIALDDTVSGLSGRLFETGGYTYLRTYKNESQYTQFALGQYSQPVHDLLQLYKLGSSVYRVYHEGNITMSTVAPISALAEGAQHQVY
ncbi:hypothetical protein FRZ06_10010 [Anoxybacterium hadale]|uniref:Uncharacterized protein n=1 Tax=Anoxybacterium hadale TaxID=3408580 RepID=A0ACD1ABU0_9FIRM|nr:hypothetical protein FRZ06_10010 [Clostridiales bacterium]